jgi:hypothetical protein
MVLQFCPVLRAAHGLNHCNDMVSDLGVLKCVYFEAVDLNAAAQLTLMWKLLSPGKLCRMSPSAVWKAAKLRGIYCAAPPATLQPSGSASNGRCPLPGLGRRHPNCMALSSGCRYWWEVMLAAGDGT